MLKLILKVSAFSTLLIISAPAFADTHYHFETCKEKAAALETQVSYAQQNKDQIKVTELQSTLDNLQTHCSNTDLQKKYQKKINEKQQKVDQRTQELQEAQQDGSKRKINNKEAKLTHAKSELSEAQQEFQVFQNKINTSHLSSK